jgi:hypothetical protein
MKWARANTSSLRTEFTQKEIEDCKIVDGITEEMKIEKVMHAIQEAWNDVCKGASKFVNSSQVIKIYLLFLFNLVFDIFDKFHFESIKKNQLCQKRLEEMTWVWFQWRCGKISDAGFLREFEDVEKLSFKIPRMLTYVELKALENNLIEKDQFVLNNLVEKGSYLRDRFMLYGEEELDVNDIVKIHTKYFRKEKSKLEIQLLKKKKRKKFKLKKKEKQHAKERCQPYEGKEEVKGLNLEREKKPQMIYL